MWFCLNLDLGSVSGEGSEHVLLSVQTLTPLKHDECKFGRTTKVVSEVVVSH